MKTIICFALCIIAISALSPIESLDSALDILDLQQLFDDHQGFELSASFTYLGGPKNDAIEGDFEVDSSSSDVDEKVFVQGTYNLLKFEDGKGKLKVGSFNKTKKFSSQGVVKFTGSGSFNARGGGKDWEGFFNGGSSTDFVFETDSGYAAGIRVHELAGEFKGHRAWGKGGIEVNVWQDVNSSSNNVEYVFQCTEKAHKYAGSSKIFGEVTTNDNKEYKSALSSVFHGEDTKKSWEVSGGYILDVVDSDWNVVYSKHGSFEKNGTQDEAFGTFEGLRSFGLPSSNLISE